MAYTSAQLAALEEAIAQGALVVQYADKRVEYRSLDDMQRIRRQMRLDLGLDTPGSGHRRYARHDKGLC